MGASMTGQADIAKLLLEHKANVDYREKMVSSTLHTHNMSETPIVIKFYHIIIWVVVSHRRDYQLYIGQVNVAAQQLFWYYWNIELKLTYWMM